MRFLSRSRTRWAATGFRLSESYGILKELQ